MNHEQLLKQLQSYKKPTGYYDITRIIQDEQPDNEHAFFSAIIGGGADDSDRDNESDLVKLARELNTEYSQEQKAAKRKEIDELIAELETGDPDGMRRNQIYWRLQFLGAGTITGDPDEGMHFTLNRDASDRDPYADQVGLEERAPDYRL